MRGTGTASGLARVRLVPTRQSRTPDAGGVDMPTLVRGASAGFTVLLIGGLLEPIVVTLLPLTLAQVPTASSWWLTVVAVAGFMLAGSRIGEATRPAVHGAGAAVGAYLLVVPLMVFASTEPLPPITTMLLAALVAVLVGAATGYVAGRRRGPAT